jgi:hypothetical protein
MNIILFVLRTGCQWRALNSTDFCSSISAHRRFRESSEAGISLIFWQQGLLACNSLKGCMVVGVPGLGQDDQSPLAGLARRVG